ncbi:hypothetical protein FQN50_000266 [Emmonsiellopsis sp. PD_5]|nr:hypothetical protein FQN50_000266 [Emmonsiellopsis sp. PD_5]
MSWDRPIHSFSYSNGEPQTPKRTPTAAGFGESAFHTPKLESSFYDPRITWDTTDPYASSPEFLKTPQPFGLSTPSNQRYLHGLADRDPTLDPSAFGHALSPQLERSSTSGTVRGKNTGSTKKARAAQRTGHGNDEKDTIDSAKRSAASMQTPPPTSTARRKMQDRNNLLTARQDTANAMDPPDSSHLETPSRVVGISANLFDNQDSPNLFHVGGSSTESPFFQQNRLFWDNGPQFTANPLEMPENFGDPFGPISSSAFDSFDPPNDSLQVPQFQMMHESAGLDQFSGGRSYNSASTIYPTSFSTSPRLPTVRDEDPKMFLSSPARRFGFSEPVLPPEPARTETRQPYHHQTEESKREKRLKELKRAQSLARRKAEMADEAVDALRQSRATNLSRRSSTHSSLPHSRQTSQNSFSSGPSASGVRKTPAKGRMSPIKTHAPPFPRPSSATLPVESVVLKIGKDGRAKTETKVVAQSPSFGRAPGMDLDESSTESESESSDESDFQITHSFTPSFNVPESTPRRPSIARAHSTSRPHSKSSSYSSAAASSHSGRHSPWASSSRGSGRVPQFAAQQENWMSRRHSTNPLASHSRGQSTTDSEVTQEDDEDAGDAQHALKQVIKGRSRQARQGIPNFNQRARSSHSLATLTSSPPTYARRGDISSPTTMTDPDFATPTTERQSNPSNSTRCVCNSNDNGGHLMIQCESCTHWLHTKCVGLDRQSLPPVYICGYCMRTPARGGRIREPLLPGHIPTSPLAHKSYRFR